MSTRELGCRKRVLVPVGANLLAQQKSDSILLPVFLGSV